MGLEWLATVGAFLIGPFKWVWGIVRLIPRESAVRRREAALAQRESEFKDLIEPNTVSHDEFDTRFEMNPSVAAYNLKTGRLELDITVVNFTVLNLHQLEIESGSLNIGGSTTGTRLNPRRGLDVPRVARTELRFDAGLPGAIQERLVAAKSNEVDVAIDCEINCSCNFNSETKTFIRLLTWSLGPDKIA